MTVRVGLRTVLGIDLRPQFPSRLLDGGYILAHNLVSPLDAFIVALAIAETGRPEPVVMLRGSIRNIPFLGPLLAAGALLLTEAGDDDAFTLAGRALDQGHAVVTSAESIVSRSLEVGSVTSDPVRLATATGAPLHAAATFGGHRLFDDGRRLRLRRGIPVGVTFGNEIPVDGSLNFAPSMRMLRIDLEALLGQTLDDYPGQEYTEGMPWWPASRFGGAPSILETMDDLDPIPSPSAELWADDTRVIEGRSRRGATVSAPMPHDEVPDDLFLEMVDPDASAAEPHRAAPPREPEPQSLPADRSRDVPIRAQTPEQLHAEHPDVWVPPATTPRPTPLSAKLAQPDAAATTPGDHEPTHGDVHGVTGLLAFDMPGQPRQLLRKVSVAATRHDLIIRTDPDPVRLLSVEVDRTEHHSFFWGQLAEDHVAVSGDMRLSIPAGTRTSFVAVRRSS